MKRMFSSIESKTSAHGEIYMAKFCTMLVILPRNIYPGLTHSNPSIRVVQYFWEVSSRQFLKRRKRGGAVTLYSATTGIYVNLKGTAKCQQVANPLPSKALGMGTRVLTEAKFNKEAIYLVHSPQIYKAIVTTGVSHQTRFRDEH